MRYWLLLAFLALAVGCSSNVKMTGTVSFSDDGSPVPSGTVCFVSDTHLARGNIVDGKFEMSSTKEGDGLPPGDYKVYFTGIETVVAEGKTGPDGAKADDQTAPSIDLKYLAADSSGLTQTVDKTTKTLEYKLDRNPNL